MTQEFADNLAKPHLESSKTLCVTSDGGVYINSDIAQMKAIAKERNLQIFVYKGEEINVAEAKEAKEEKKSKKSKE